MLLTEFFNNPMGKGASAMNLKATKADYDKRYELYYKSITIKSFFVGKAIFVALKIPSSVNGIFYDVLFKFTEQSGWGGTSVNDMKFQMFSNSPSFLYTYAYAYAKHGLLVSDMKKRVGDQLAKEKAMMKNPYTIISYDYSIYLGLKFLILNGYLEITSLHMIEVPNASMKKVHAEIQDWDTLQALRGDQKKANAIAKQKEREERLRDQRQINTNGDNSIHKIGKIKKIPVTKKVSKTKKISTVKQKK